MFILKTIQEHDREELKPQGCGTPERLPGNAGVSNDRFGPQVVPVCAYGLSFTDRRGNLTRTSITRDI